MMSEDVKKMNRRLEGTVTSLSGEKSIVVKVQRRIKHKYGKYMSRTTKVHVHDAEGKAKSGDHVVIESCRPYSKLKTWQLIDILQTENT